MTTPNAQVVAVYPDKVQIEIDDLEEFFIDHGGLKIGSFLNISDNENCQLIAIIQNFSLEIKDNGRQKYLIDALPLGTIQDDTFTRGGDTLSIPPTGVQPTNKEEVQLIFESSIEENKKFTFSTLIHYHDDIKIPVDGNRFFNKHIAVVGSTGSGKSHTVSSLLQQVVSQKEGNFSLNNSHIIIFDIHSEYKTAFPEANHLDISNLKLPYWLLNSSELEEILLDTGERDNYNQASVFRQLVTLNKKKHNPDAENIYYDSPFKFKITEILNALHNIKNETINSKSPKKCMFVTSEEDGEELEYEEKINKYFDGRYEFKPTKSQSISKGTYADGTLEKFFLRFESKVNDARLKFLFDNELFDLDLTSVLKNILGYQNNHSNVTVLDLSGIPFEVLSITVSLISRLLFDYGYHYKQFSSNISDRISNNDAPFLLVYEEAHKYVPKSDLVKYRSAQQSIERIAKEGRKYGITLLLATQRPSEVSETIFAQCSNFIVMRLTNPNDQNYITRLLPDTLGNMTNKLPILRSGEALLLGEAVVMPLFVKIKKCSPEPSSNDIPYFELWKREWKDIDFKGLSSSWSNR
ncbi:anti-phage-associated helicase HerA [Neisseria animaloris]|uniref:anti-phage-associated helicase HerA n=1 Tax=Neisseria animaloris TaxID=326522 RepID=UPI0039DFBF70